MKKMNNQTQVLLESLDIDIPYLKTPVGYLSGGDKGSLLQLQGLFFKEGI